MPHQSYQNSGRRGVTPGLGLCMLTNLLLKEQMNEYANKFSWEQVGLIGSLHAWEARNENEALWRGKLLC